MDGRAPPKDDCRKTNVATTLQTRYKAFNSPYCQAQKTGKARRMTGVSNAKTTPTEAQLVKGALLSVHCCVEEHPPLSGNPAVHLQALQVAEIAAAGPMSITRCAAGACSSVPPPGSLHTPLDQQIAALCLPAATPSKSTATPTTIFTTTLDRQPNKTIFDVRCSENAAALVSMLQGGR